MNQQGFVIDIIDNRTAKMIMQRHSACASCGKCSKLSSECQDLVVEVDNSIGAKKGDRVEVSMESVQVLKATMLAYLVPLIFLLAGTILTYYILDLIKFLGPIEVISGVVGLICTGISYLLLRKNDDKFKQSRQYIPRITKIIEGK
ncbi:SoxR reducing system RseC family protein [Terrisporobacter petrolearius]|uniref:SoxR reducing system RseC family protein n=1 Tax=Terrisporobacter petrolearius TaxID=1460447 RepID=UPI001D16F34E|nr:SoxR reducing system RseC family protein [Terrisporobacter petrolearius]MCC3865103.1 SoxR reducing system RseC family protein [Terrisporobacter petrolearius]